MLLCKAGCLRQQRRAQVHAAQRASVSHGAQRSTAPKGTTAKGSTRVSSTVRVIEIEREVAAEAAAGNKPAHRQQPLKQRGHQLTAGKEEVNIGSSHELHPQHRKARTEGGGTRLGCRAIGSGTALGGATRCTRRDRHNLQQWIRCLRFGGHDGSKLLCLHDARGAHASSRSDERLRTL